MSSFEIDVIEISYFDILGENICHIQTACWLKLISDHIVTCAHAAGPFTSIFMSPHAVKLAGGKPAYTLKIRI